MNLPSKPDILNKLKAELLAKGDKKKQARNVRIVASALSSLPWIGGFISIGSTIKNELDQEKTNEFQKIWFEEHSKKIEELGETIRKILEKIDSIDESFNDRVESEEYLQIVREGFKKWDNAKTNEKKEFIRKLITNAGANNITTDDVIQLFLDWVEKYHELHFAVIKEIYNQKGATRAQIWSTFNDHLPAENSKEADLYKLMFRDLSTGGIIRQVRQTDVYGNLYKQPSKKKPSKTLTSAFDDGKEYELTELGKQFVHFTMEEVVTKLK